MRRLFLAITFIVCLLPVKNFAAGPIMHIALAERYLGIYAKHYTEEEKKLFMLGTLFPDIRYLGVIKRDQSHFKNVTIEKVNQELSPFKKGMLFHSLVDENRSRFVKQSAIEKKIGEVPSKFRGIFLKLVEDEILHAQSDWSQIRLYLATIPEEETAFNINFQALTQWHTGLTVYFTTLPSIILMQFSLFEKSILMVDAQTIKQWSIILPKYAADSGIQAYVKSLMQEFDKILREDVT